MMDYTITADPLDSEQREYLLMNLVREFQPRLENVGLALHRDSKGKPYLVRKSSGQREPGIHFSISHSGGLWACVISDCPCGFDLQQRRPANYELLAKRFFSPRECAYVEAAGAEGFYEIWTRREALAKYTGLGFFGMSEVRPCLVDEDGKPAASTVWNGKMVSFETISVPEGYMAVWCHEEGEDE